MNIFTREGGICPTPLRTACLPHTKQKKWYLIVYDNTESFKNSFNESAFKRGCTSWDLYCHHQNADRSQKEKHRVRAEGAVWESANISVVRVRGGNWTDGTTLTTKKFISRLFFFLLPIENNLIKKKLSWKKKMDVFLGFKGKAPPPNGGPHPPARGCYCTFKKQCGGIKKK